MTDVQPASAIPVWVHPVTWIIVITGWIIVNWQNNRREERKEIRTAITLLSSEITTLVEKAITYHSAPLRSRKKENEIVRLEKLLSERLSFLRLRRSSYSKQYADFSDSITLENFETPSFHAQAFDSPLVENIKDTAGELISSLEAEYSALFRGSSFVKTRAFWRQEAEIGGGITGVIALFFTRYQTGIIIFLAYLGIIAFIWRVALSIQRSLQS